VAAGLAMSWQIRLGAVGAAIGAGEGLDLAALRSLVPLVDGAPIRVAGREVGHVREPVLLGRELFAVAEITAAAFAGQLGEWERRGCLSTVVGLSIIGRRVPVAAAECEPSSAYVDVVAVTVTDVPRGGAGCFLWSEEAAAAGGGVLPGLEAGAPGPRRPRHGPGEDPLRDLRQRFARRAPAGVRP